MRKGIKIRGEALQYMYFFCTSIYVCMHVSVILTLVPVDTLASQPNEMISYNSILICFCYEWIPVFVGSAVVGSVPRELRASKNRTLLIRQHRCCCSSSLVFVESHRHLLQIRKKNIANSFFLQYHCTTRKNACRLF